MILFATGALMVAASAAGIYLNTRAAYLRRMVNKYQTDCKLDLRIGRTTAENMIVTLPYGMTITRFRTHQEGLEMAVGTFIRIRPLYGRTLQLTFGNTPFYEVMHYTGPEEAGPLAVPLFTPFGIRYMNFADETNCHLLVGGASRMGKTVLLRLLVTRLMEGTGGNVSITLIDNKVTDLHMFQGIPQIKIAETIGEARAFVQDVLQLMQDRKALLKSKADVVDAKEFREKYPAEKMDPIFVIIDEYGRFADDEEFQKMVIEIAETAGYLDVHLVIATQRPDATSAIKPRIKANIVTRIAFSTADEANSTLILGVPDAAHLGRIQGRALVMDGFPERVQVPYITSEEVKEILRGYYRDDEPRQAADPAAEALPSFVSGPVGEADLSAGSPPVRNRKPNRTKTRKGGLDTADNPTEG